MEGQVCASKWLKWPALLGLLLASAVGGACTEPGEDPFPKVVDAEVADAYAVTVDAAVPVADGGDEDGGLVDAAVPVADAAVADAGLVDAAAVAADAAVDDAAAAD